MWSLCVGHECNETVYACAEPGSVKSPGVVLKPVLLPIRCIHFKRGP